MPDSNTLMAPVPPSTRRAEVNASTGAVLRRIMFTAVLMTGPRGPEFMPLPWMMRTQRRLCASASARNSRKRRFGFVDAQPVQIADFLDAVFTALELAHDAVLHADAAEGDFVAGVGDLVRAGSLQAFHQHHGAIRGGESRFRRRLAFGGRHARAGRDRLDVAHGLAKHRIRCPESVRLPFKLPPR